MHCNLTSLLTGNRLATNQATYLIFWDGLAEDFIIPQGRLKPFERPAQFAEGRPAGSTVPSAHCSAQTPCNAYVSKQHLLLDLSFQEYLGQEICAVLSASLTERELVQTLCKYAAVLPGDVVTWLVE